MPLPQLATDYQAGILLNLSVGYGLPNMLPVPLWRQGMGGRAPAAGLGTAEKWTAALFSRFGCNARCLSQAYPLSCRRDWGDLRSRTIQVIAAAMTASASITAKAD